MFLVLISIALEIYIKISFSIITPNNMKDSKHHLNLIEVCVCIQMNSIFIEHFLCMGNSSKFWNRMDVKFNKINV